MENVEAQNMAQDTLVEKLVQVNRVAKTVKGKGVSYMEGKWKYHVVIPSSEEDIRTGLEELS